MTPLDTLRALITQGESETLEPKRSTADLRRAGDNSDAVTVTFTAEIVPGPSSWAQAGAKFKYLDLRRNHGRTRSRWPRPGPRDRVECMRGKRA